MQRKKRFMEKIGGGFFNRKMEVFVELGGKGSGFHKN